MDLQPSVLSLKIKRRLWVLLSMINRQLNTFEIMMVILGELLPGSNFHQYSIAKIVRTAIRLKVDSRMTDRMPSLLGSPH